MIVLAIDTALEACSVAVLDGERALARRVEPMARGHQERLVPLVAEAMAEAGLGFSDLERAGVTVGPGSFTGLRVGLAFAKSLALALSIPCVGIGTLEAMLASAQEAAAPRAAAALDARRGNVYLQAFAAGAPLMEPANLALDEALARLADLGFAPGAPLLGTGAPLLGGPAPANAAELVDPVAVARLAAARVEPLAPAAPLYLRAPDAKTIAERAAAAG